ncbi:hypothetical protein H257_11775 [Aphanomyces astaci]|uniref:Uncharacterized protein n=1 Tax=Aphanomyces astaci TaxID=112090 RepID=W4G1W6_APHAT|nr:hypothetical protein H257_11775 [Aphanomyces astaci]ETV73675.1 hypothetical protein H257_11775 [Aphanomyces astaci]RQM27476.1 hypothetical protein B5M09_004518 [Aphanomyces astaci]|eukprot:XP_009837101.1 hypothetical protein H257_11775 [Aphanomyces astaci]
MSSMRPAGHTKKDSEPFGKKKLGRNVEVFIAREEQLSTAMRNTKVSNHIKGRAVWEDKQGKRGVTYTRQRVDKQITEEIEMANRELLAIRSERIKAYYTNCYIAMPYQVVPGLAVITLAFTLTGAGIGFVNRWYAKGNQKKLILRDDWDHLLDARDKRLKDRAAWEAVLEKERQQQH